MSNIMKPECPPTTHGETQQSPHYGHQRAENMHTSSQSKASKTIHKASNEAKCNHNDTKDHKGQHNSVIRPTWTEKTGEPQEQKHHKEILSVHIDDAKINLQCQGL